MEKEVTCANLEFLVANGCNITHGVFDGDSAIKSAVLAILIHLIVVQRGRWVPWRRWGRWRRVSQGAGTPRPQPVHGPTQHKARNFCGPHRGCPCPLLVEQGAAVLPGQSGGCASAGQREREGNGGVPRSLR